MSGPRLYDVMSDSFITDRTQITDRLVRDAASMLTYSARNPIVGVAWDGEREEFLRAAKESQRTVWAIWQTVRILWRAEVERAVQSVEVTHS